MCPSVRHDKGMKLRSLVNGLQQLHNEIGVFQLTNAESMPSRCRIRCVAQCLSIGYSRGHCGNQTKCNCVGQKKFEAAMDVTFLFLFIYNLLDILMCGAQQFRFSPSVNEIIRIIPVSQREQTSIRVEEYHRERVIYCLRRGIMFASRMCRHHRRCLVFPRTRRCSINGLSSRRQQDFADHFDQRIPASTETVIRDTPVCNISCPVDTHLYGGVCQAGGHSLCSPGCPDDFTCHHGRCERSPCNQPCSGRLRCRNRQCVDIERCTPACCPGQICRFGRCEDDSPSPSTGTCNPPCPTGFICHNGHCDKDQRCKEPCPPGFECHFGHCHRLDVAHDHSHCTPPCGPNEECHDGHCERLAVRGHHDHTHGDGHADTHSHDHHREGSFNSLAVDLPRGTQRNPPNRNGPPCNPPCSAAEMCRNGRCDPVIPGFEEAVTNQMNGNFQDPTRIQNNARSTNTPQVPRTTGSMDRQNSGLFGQPWNMLGSMGTNNWMNPSAIQRLANFPAFGTPVAPFPIQNVGQGVLPSAVRPVPLNQQGTRPINQQLGSTRPSISPVDSWFTTQWSDESRLLSQQQGG